MVIVMYVLAALGGRNRRRQVVMQSASSSIESKMGPDKLLADSVALTRLDKAVGWARKYSLFPYPFATACCAMEYMSLSMSPYDIDRFRALLPRFGETGGPIDGYRNGKS